MKTAADTVRMRRKKCTRPHLRKSGPLAEIEVRAEQSVALEGEHRLCRQGRPKVPSHKESLNVDPRRRALCRATRRIDDRYGIVADSTELETLLRACVDDVRKEIVHHRGGGSSPAKSLAGGAAGTPGSARAVAVEDLGPKERERVLELLLSQERVVTLLYERTFPTPPAADDTDVLAESGILGASPSAGTIEGEASP